MMIMMIIIIIIIIIILIITIIIIIIKKDKWYEHAPDSVSENDEVKLLWDVNIECDHVIEAR